MSVCCVSWRMPCDDDDVWVLFKYRYNTITAGCKMNLIASNREQTEKVKQQQQQLLRVGDCKNKINEWMSEWLTDWTLSVDWCGIGAYGYRFMTFPLCYLTRWIPSYVLSTCVCIICIHQISCNTKHVSSNCLPIVYARYFPSFFSSILCASLFTSFSIFSFHFSYCILNILTSFHQQPHFSEVEIHPTQKKEKKKIRRIICDFSLLAFYINNNIVP